MCRIKVTNDRSDFVTLWLEPWGEDYGMLPADEFDIVAVVDPFDFDQAAPPSAGPKILLACPQCRAKLEMALRQPCGSIRRKAKAVQNA